MFLEIMDYLRLFLIHQGDREAAGKLGRGHSLQVQKPINMGERNTESQAFESTNTNLMKNIQYFQDFSNEIDAHNYFDSS